MWMWCWVSGESMEIRDHSSDPEAEEGPAELQRPGSRRWEHLLAAAVIWCANGWTPNPLNVKGQT